MTLPPWTIRGSEGLLLGVPQFWVFFFLFGFGVPFGVLGAFRDLGFLELVCSDGSGFYSDYCARPPLVAASPRAPQLEACV